MRAGQRRTRQRGAARLIGVLVAGLAFVLYACTLAGVYTGDDLETAIKIERWPLADLVVPHRLLVQPLHWAFARLWGALGWPAGVLLPLQLANAAGGAVCAGLVYSIARRLTGSASRSVPAGAGSTGGSALAGTGSMRGSALAGAGFAVSSGVWMFSTGAEPVMVPLALSLVPVWLLLAGGPRPSRGRVALLGLLVGLAILTYLTSAFLVPIVGPGLAWAGDGDRPRGERWRRVALFVGVVAVVVVPVYLAATYLLFGVRDWPALLAWRAYGGIDAGADSQPYGRLAWSSVPLGAYGLARSLLWYPPLAPDASTSAYLAGATSVEQAAFGAFQAVALVILAAPLILVVLRRAWAGLDRRGGTVMATWAVLYGAFGVWWVPGDVQFWLPVLVVWWLLVAIVLAAPLGDAAARPAGRPPGSAISRSMVAVVVAGVLAMFLVNGLGLVALNRRAEGDRRYALAIGVAANTAPADRIVTSGIDDAPLRAYVQYFGRRQVVPIYQELARELAAAGGRDEAEALAAVDRQIGAVRAAGGRAFLVRPRDEETDPVASERTGAPRLWPNWQANEAGRLTLRYLERVKTRPAWQVDGETVFEIVP